MLSFKFFEFNWAKNHRARRSDFSRFLALNFVLINKFDVGVVAAAAVLAAVKSQLIMIIEVTTMM